MHEDGWATISPASWGTAYKAKTRVKVRGWLIAPTPPNEAEVPDLFACLLFRSRFVTVQETLQLVSLLCKSTEILNAHLNICIPRPIPRSTTPAQLDPKDRPPDRS
jgi:hypothetical protein